MSNQTIKISQILNKVTHSPNERDYYTLCLVKDGVNSIVINNITHKHVANSLFFLNPNFKWEIHKSDSNTSAGYLIYLPKSILNHPTFNNLQITQVRYFKEEHQIPKIKLSPGIEKRVQAIVEMLDELVSTNLKNKEDAILSLLNTLFIYCDGQCNIKSVITDNNAKAALVYKFKKSIDQEFSKHHEVNSYAQLLNVSDRYLNECVKEVLGINAKSLIDEQLIMRTRHKLKFTDKSIKEVGYELGFSSPDYFSYFIKKHTGLSPSQIRKS